MVMKFRVEQDGFGELLVPFDAVYGAQTQRAVQNFALSGRGMPPEFLRALALLKACVAQANGQLGHLGRKPAKAIERVALEIAGGAFADQFPVDVFQTGSGTSTNMNMNEVIAGVVKREHGLAVHPNNDVNNGQSSNDMIPSASLVSAAVALKYGLLPALKALRRSIQRKARQAGATLKTGRTHLMDAMPMTVAQEWSGWAAQLDSAIARLDDSGKRLTALPLGGTAVGTGVNADPKMPALACKALAKHTGIAFKPAGNKFESIAAQDHLVELSGQCNALAVTLMKIANDLRWMNSGPLTGLAELELPALQPGSSIMPGKVNPVIPEAVAMACAQVMGLHTAVSIAGQSGNFQLNTMMPLIADNSLQSLNLLAAACTHLAEKAINGITFNTSRMNEALARNPILVTALNPVIGYEAAARIAKRAYAEKRPVIDVAKDMTDLSLDELKVLLDPARLTTAGG
ncbi:fumarate hydratase class II [Arenimonas maotaiensis]|uniref:Fumarate hydratase class II n=1 Tax=Arenimonas maotaiensis TaxID=1446479 RepID=A0A917CB87_9GAMM|nr:class II fumarate hydratase [Arenimonas maotaiensis]GGF83000.1 fumarate hydratase class II [Arenimonas maotaiensis]